MLVRTIFIAWKKKEGSQRHIVAKLKRNVSEGISFDYCPEGFENAKKEGFDYFLGFKNASKLTPEQFEQLLALRVISKDRPDRGDFLSFWEADKNYDTFDTLALTQGKSPTDSFEFLALYYPKHGLKFVTDIAGLSSRKHPRGTVEKGDILRVVLEPENPHDDSAVAVFKGDLKIGYIKRIHNKAFWDRRARTPKLIVKGVDQNGVVKQIFVSVAF